MAERYDRDDLSGGQHVGLVSEPVEGRVLDLAARQDCPDDEHQSN
jgi:hypothetical protein